MDEQLLARVEALRIPLEDLSSPIDWKDWYHFLLLDNKTGIRVLVNVTMMGRPGHGEIQVSLIITLPDEQTNPELPHHRPLSSFGTTFCGEWQPGMVHRYPLRLQAKGIHLEVNGKNSFIEAFDERAQLSIRLEGEAEAMPLLVTEDSPFGSGFIGWGLVPGLQVRGELSVCGQSWQINRNWFCYHDRNFGRFRWGEDIGWEWFVAYATTADGKSLTLVLDRRTNKDHSQGGLPYIFIYVGTELRKIFVGASLNIHWDWTVQATLPPRLPGIMASLFSDRILRLPQTLEVNAADEQDQLSLHVQFDAMTELVVPDNQEIQYTFIEEVTGNTNLTLTLQGETLSAQGLLYAEYVQ